MDIMNMIEIVLGFFCGILSSAIVSVVWSKTFLPSIKFSEQICKSDRTDNESYSYRIKFRNTGKRNIFELSVYSTVFLYDFPSKGSIHTFDINMSYGFRVIFKKRKEKNVLNPDAVVKFLLNDNHLVNELCRPLYTKEISQKARSCQITLEDILCISPNAYIKIYVIAHDSFTGNKRIFESKKYRKSDIKMGHYKLGDLCIV